MAKYRCIIIDDDDIDRLGVVLQVKRYPSLDIAGIFKSAEAALPILEKEPIDILFLDIDMPALDGLQFRKMAAGVPVCIFISAHTEHALETFELGTLDFIAKPLKTDRFAQTMNRIDDYMNLRFKANLYESALGEGAIYIKEGHEKVKINLHEIPYLEALKDYTKIITADKNHCVLSSLGVLLKSPDFNSFIRIHRSYAVQKQFVKKIGAAEIVLNDQTILPVGRSYKDNLSQLL